LIIGIRGTFTRTRGQTTGAGIALTSIGAKAAVAILMCAVCLAIWLSIRGSIRLQPRQLALFAGRHNIETFNACFGRSVPILV